MEIIFRGLIAHVKVDNRDISRAILVKESSHVPKLAVKDHDIRGTPTFPRLFGAPAGETWFNLEGQQVKIEGLISGPTIRQPLFDRNVPSLLSVLDFPGDRKLDDDVHGDRLHRNASTYINLTGGILDVVDCFPKQAIFDDPQQGDPVCLAKHVRYSTGDFPPTLFFVGKNGVKVEVVSSATVRVCNFSGSGIHFHMFHAIAADYATGIRDIHPNDGKSCKDCLPIAEVAVGADVECTNSHWP